MASTSLTMRECENHLSILRAAIQTRAQKVPLVPRQPHLPHLNQERDDLATLDAQLGVISAALADIKNQEQWEPLSAMASRCGALIAALRSCIEGLMYKRSYPLQVLATMDAPLGTVGTILAHFTEEASQRELAARKEAQEVAAYVFQIVGRSAFVDTNLYHDSALDQDDAKTPKRLREEKENPATQR